MKQFINLLKISLNVNFGISALRYRFTREKKRLWEPILIFLAIIIGGGSLVAFFTMVLYSVYAAGVFMNTPEIVITIGLLASQFVIFVFGIFYIISAFYFSNDVDILVPLPLKPYHILGTKFLIILINEYLVLLPMLIPAIIIYGVGTRPDIAYWFKSVFIMLLSPVIPLIIASVFVLVLMRLINVRKSKDLLMVIGGLLGLFLGVAINYFAQRMSNGNPDEFMQDLLTSRINIIDKLGEKLPHVLWGTYSLSKPGIEGLLYFALTIAVAAIAFIFLLWLGNRIFYKGLLSGQEVSRKKRSLSAEQINRKTQKTSNPVTALFWREWKLFLRTPIYMINGLAGMIMVPFLLLMPYFSGSGDMQELISMATDPQFITQATLVGLAIVLFTASINIVSCTSLSREGQTFWISKVIPISPKQQVTAKLLHGMAISGIGILFTIIIIAFVLQLSPVRLFTILILGILGSFLLNTLNLIIDVIRPKLVWNDPQEAVKQNLNGFFSILLTFVSLIIWGVLSALLFKIGIPEGWVYIILGLSAAILSVPSLAILYTLAESSYRKLEL
ncbi:MAG: hypothetical protein GX041_09375 [Clostridiales bacterium]|jgi:ABC-2 type transport system permease protein|nr:hypothetical protein [Clostridiales bacterium]